MSHLRRKTLDLAQRPGRWVVRPLETHYKKRYHEQHDYPKLIFALDLLILGVLIGLALTLVTLFFFNRNPIAKQVDFSASVAPQTITSGAPSTLIISWHNTSEETLRNAELSLAYPDHFLLQDLVFLHKHIEGTRVPLGTIPPGGTGSLKIRGVMFGDVGGEQVFTSDLTFRYGERNRQGFKNVDHHFKPQASALTIDVSLSETLVSEQRVQGELHLTNTGPVDFSQIAIEPTASVFDFVIKNSNVAQNQNGVWVLQHLPSGASVDLIFEGRAPQQAHETQSDWSFSASFTFEDTTYFQGETRHHFTLIPSPLTLEKLVHTPTITPGGNLSLTGTYRNISEEPLQNIAFFLESDSPFLAQRDSENAVFEAQASRWDAAKRHVSLAPGEEGTFDMTIPIRTTIPRSATDQYENLFAQINLGAEFLLSKADISAQVRTSPLALPVTSPITLQTFGRYSTPQGDQIGRGPLPPVVGEETKYWVFWNLSGTTNTLEQVEIQATLPSHTHGGSKQTASIGRPVNFENGRVSWYINRLEPTFAPGSKTVSIAFEVALVPSKEQIGQTLTILDNIQLTATDALTGEIVQAFGARVTTDLPDDAMAAGLSRVEAL